MSKLVTITVNEDANLVSGSNCRSGAEPSSGSMRILLDGRALRDETVLASVSCKNNPSIAYSPSPCECASRAATQMNLETPDSASRRCVAQIGSKS